MKRYVSLACIAMVLVMCMVSPVSAADLSSDYIDLLDYTNGGIFFTFSGSNRVAIPLPYYSHAYYVDMTFQCIGGVPAVESIVYDMYHYPLTVVYIGDNTYRAYGSIGAFTHSELYFNFSSSSTLYVTINSCLVRLTNSSFFDSDCYCGISAIDYDKTIHFVSSDDINYRTFTGTEDIYNMGYQLYLYNLNWKKYDYIDYMLYTVVDSISSVNCTMGGISVPFEISYISNDPSIASDFIYTIRVDCRGLNRSTDDYPMVTVSGNVITGSANMVSVVSCYGIVEDSIDVYGSLISRLISNLTQHFSNLSTWFSTQNSIIGDWFSTLNIWMSAYKNDIVNAIRGDTTPGNSFQQQVNQKDQQLNDMAAVMESVDQPDLNSVNVSANTYVDGTVLAASMSGITSVFSQGLFFDIIVMSIMMATAGYVLFGKR